MRDLKAWWLSLNPREQMTLSLGGIALIIALAYLLVWEPVFDRREQLTASVRAQRNTLVWMEQAASEIQRLSVAPAASRVQSGNQSLLTVVDTSSRRARLRGSIQRMEPESKTGVKLWVEDADFDALVRWLGDLERGYGIDTARVSLDRADKPGRIDSRLSLKRQ